LVADIALLQHFCLNDTAERIAMEVGISRRAVISLLAKMRARILEWCNEEERLYGEIEVDESFFGARRVRGKRGRGASGKVPVIGLLKRNGKVYTQVVVNCSREQ
jgi:transposase